MVFEMVPFLNYLLICFLVNEKVRGTSIVTGANDIGIPEKTYWNNGISDVHYSNVENITPRSLFRSPWEPYFFDRKVYNRKSNLRQNPNRQQQNKTLKVNSTRKPNISTPIDSNSNATIQSTNKDNSLDKFKSAKTLDENFIKQVRKFALYKLSQIRKSAKSSEPFKEYNELNTYSQLRADAISKGKPVDKSIYNEMKYTKRGTKSFNNPATLANDIISVWQIKYSTIIYSKNYKKYKFGLGVAKTSNGQFYAVSNLI